MHYANGEYLYYAHSHSSSPFILHTFQYSLEWEHTHTQLSTLLPRIQMWGAQNRARKLNRQWKEHRERHKIEWLMLTSEQKKTSLLSQLFLLRHNFTLWWMRHFRCEDTTPDGYTEIKVILETDLFTFAEPCIFYMPILKPRSKERLLCIPLTLFMCLFSKHFFIFHKHTWTCRRKSIVFKARQTDAHTTRLKFLIVRVKKYNSYTRTWDAVQ